MAGGQDENGGDDVPDSEGVDIRLAPHVTIHKVAQKNELDRSRKTLHNLQFFGESRELLRRLRAEREGLLLAGAAAALEGARGLPAQGRQGGQAGDSPGGEPLLLPGAWLVINQGLWFKYMRNWFQKCSQKVFVCWSVAVSSTVVCYSGLGKRISAIHPYLKPSTVCQIQGI